MFTKPKSVTNSCLELSIKGIHYLNICVTKNKIQWNLTLVDGLFCLPFINLRLTFLWPPTVKRAAKATDESYEDSGFELKRNFPRYSSRSSRQTCHSCWPLSSSAVVVAAATLWSRHSNMQKFKFGSTANIVSILSTLVHQKKTVNVFLKHTILFLLETGLEKR